MEQLIIKKTKHSPNVELNPEGTIKINGRCIVEDSIEFYSPIFNWINNFSQKKLEVELNFEYVNTSSVKQLFTMLSLIKANKNITELYVNWYFEEGDDDMLELGKDIESQINIPFDFFEYAEKIA